MGFGKFAYNIQFEGLICIAIIELYIAVGRIFKCDFYGKLIIEIIINNN